MLLLGEMNRLKVIKEVDFGLYLDGEIDEILIPKRYVPVNTQVGDMLDVFLYRDSEDRLIATTQLPKVMVGEYALLEVVDTNRFGVFMDWGMPKDLFVPFQEQNGKMAIGRSYVVKVYIDNETNRIAASARIEHFLEKENLDFEIGQEVEIIPFKYTDLGVKAIVNREFEGMLYTNEIFERINLGETKKAFVNKIRNDGKIDLKLKRTGYSENSTSQNTVMVQLNKNNGFLPFHDKSSPEAIYDQFGMSKRDFKQAIGGLYKENKIKIGDNGITICN
jgi:uncharacterized protein